MVDLKPMVMTKSDKIFLGAFLAVNLLIIFSIYTTNLAVNAPHEEDVWIQACFRTTDWASGVNITQIATNNMGILYYAGHYDFNSGNYTIYSEGEPGWLYRKITKIEILTEQKKLEMELKVP